MLILLQGFDIVYERRSQKLEFDMSTTAGKSLHKRVSLVTIIVAAIFFGFISGLGGAFLLSHSLLQQPLQAHHEENMRFNLQVRQKIGFLEEELDTHKEEIVTIANKIEFIVTEDSSSYISSIYKLQKDYADKEREVMNRLAALERQMNEFGNTQEAFATNVEEAKDDLDKVDKSISDDLREIKNTFNDLENKLKQLKQDAN
jgi:hypothetical protein